MRAAAQHRMVHVAAGVLLGGVLLWAGVAKAMHPDDLTPAISALGPVFAERAVGLACVLAAIEILIGLGVLGLKQRAIWGTGAALLLGAYTLYLGWLLTLPDAPRCGCLGIRLGRTPVREHWAGILRNLGLIACAAIVIGSAADAERVGARAVAA